MNCLCGHGKGMHYGGEKCTLAYCGCQRFRSDEIDWQETPVYGRESLPGRAFAWFRARKLTATNMVRIDGPFRVVTREGEMRCGDGYLALDQAGDPYPIAEQVYNLSYEPVEE